MFKVGASVIVICLALLSLAYCRRNKLKTCCSKCKGHKEDCETQDNDGMSTTKKEDEIDNVDSQDADGSKGTDSDKMVDEEDEV